MIELPEALNLAKQLNDSIVGKTVARALPPTKEHRFCWFNGDPSDYESQLLGCRVEGAQGFGIYVEIAFSDDLRLCVNDGVNMRFIDEAAAPKNYQLLIVFDDGTALVFTVAMYGGIVMHHGEYDNEYYLKSTGALSPFSDEFPSYFEKMLETSKPTLSAKAFLGTEQRFPGIGNGVLQDILFNAHIHPKRKISTLSDDEIGSLLASVISTLSQMCERGGRDTEKDLFGKPGGYLTCMSKNTIDEGCPECGGKITKQAYLGGSVYYCAHCQPVD